jgi:polar amino acid transport system substrate-binding protein
MAVMRKLLLLLIASLYFSSLARAESACPSLVITGHPAYPPIGWASHGKIVGAGAELVTSIARQLGVDKVDSKDFGSWENAQQAARRGQADVIFGVYKNDERATYLNYVDPPFMQDPVVIVVRKGEGFAFGKKEDLKGRRGVTNAGESYGNRLDAYMTKALKVTRAQGVDQAFEALLGGQADYLIIGLYPGKDEAKRLGIASKVDFLPGELETEDMYVAFSKKSGCQAALKRGFSAGLKRAVQQGRVEQLLDAAEKQLEQ